MPAPETVEEEWSQPALFDVERVQTDRPRRAPRRTPKSMSNDYEQPALFEMDGVA